MSKTKPLTAAALKTLVKVSDATVSRWVRKGIPHQKQPTGRGGAPMLLFKLDDALEWIEMNASTGAATMARAARSGKDANTPDPPPEPDTATPGLTMLELSLMPDPPPEPDTATPDPDSIDDEGLLPCLERLRKTERETFRLLQRLKRSGDIGGVRVVSERFVSEVRALAAIEAAAVSFRLRIGELCVVSEVETMYSRVFVGVKNAVLGIPSSVMPLIIPHLRRPESAHEISRLLDSRCRDALRSAAERGRADAAARASGATEGTAIPPATGKGKRKPRATG